MAQPWLTIEATADNGRGGVKENVTNPNEVSELFDMSYPLSISTPMLCRTAKILGKAWGQAFDRGGSRGSKWPDITDDSRKDRKVNFEAPPLTDSGAFREAATATKEGVQDSLFHIDEESGTLTMGVERKDARAHLLGNRKIKKDGTMGGEPPRNYMEITGNELRQIYRAADEYLECVVEGKKFPVDKI